MRKGKTRKIGVAVERPATTYAQITTSSPGIFPKKIFFLGKIPRDEVAQIS